MLHEDRRYGAAGVTRTANALFAMRKSMLVGFIFATSAALSVSQCKESPMEPDDDTEAARQIDQFLTEEQDDGWLTDEDMENIPF